MRRTRTLVTMSTTLSYAMLVVACQMLLIMSAATMNRQNQEEYLKRFSHLGVMNPDPRMAALQSHPEEQFRMAVRSFQRFAGLTSTGVVDNKTMEMMQMPRCGVPDLQNNMGGIARRRRRRRYTTAGDKWLQTKLTYRLQNFTRDLSPTVVQEDIKKAFKLWSDVSPLTFTEVSRLSDIEISFHTNRVHGDQSPFDGEGGTLAHAYFPGGGIGGDVHFDDEETYTSGPNAKTDLLQVATHELGHSLGLGHSENQDAIMAPFYRGYKPNLKLHSDDIEGITYLYGRKPTTKSVPKVVTTPRPTIDTGNPVTTFCGNPFVDAIDIINGTIHLFYDDKYLQLDDNGLIRPGFPKRIAETFPKLPNKLDAVLSLESESDGTVYFFKQKSFYKYNSKRPRVVDGPYYIKDYLSSDLDSVDAAFIWSGNGQIFFIKDNNTYRYYNYGGRGYTYLSRPLVEWGNLPSSINDAFRHRTSMKTYFFSKNKLYIFNDRDFKAESSEELSDWLHCCQFRVRLLETMMLQYQGQASKGPISSLMALMALVALGSTLSWF